MSKGKDMAVKVGMAILVILYVIALTVSLVKTGPTPEDLQSEIASLKQQLSESQERGRQNQTKLEAANKKLDQLLKKYEDLQAQTNGGSFSGGGSSGSFAQPSGGTSTPPTGGGSSNGGTNGGGSSGGGSSGGGSTDEGQDAGLIDDSLCTLQLLCL